MVARRRGRIIKLASHAGIHRWPQVSAYVISKSAVIKFTENLAVELKRTGVAVFALHPGTVTAGPTEELLGADVPGDSPPSRRVAWRVGFDCSSRKDAVSHRSELASSW
jgi:short-subunit dehydrogenase